MVAGHHFTSAGGVGCAQVSRTPMRLSLPRQSTGLTFASSSSWPLTACTPSVAAASASSRWPCFWILAPTASMTRPLRPSRPWQPISSGRTWASSPFPTWSRRATWPRPPSSPRPVPRARPSSRAGRGGHRFDRTRNNLKSVLSFRLYSKRQDRFYVVSSTNGYRWKGLP